MAEEKTEQEDEKPKIFYERSPSEEFQNIVCDGATLVATCDFCSRTHYGDGLGGDWEPGERERLEQNAKERPDWYVDSGDHSIGIGWIDGRQWVYDCPCNAISKYESFIWNNRHLIAKYLSEKAKDRLESAQREAGMLVDMPFSPDAKARKVEP